MPELLVIVPSRNRPHTVAELHAAYAATCTARTQLLVAIDESDVAADAYREAAAAVTETPGMVQVVTQPSKTMVQALNLAAAAALDPDGGEAPAALGFMGDDHRPRTVGWDTAYLTALAGRPGIVYGDDTVQGPRLPTQCAISAGIVRRWGHMAPPGLTHLYVDNYWHTIGRESGCLVYLPQVVVEHVHPVAGKTGWDVDYRRVNAPEMYARDRAAYADHMRAHGAADVQAVLAARAEAGT